VKTLNRLRHVAQSFKIQKETLNFSSSAGSTENLNPKMKKKIKKRLK